MGASAKTAAGPSRKTYPPEPAGCWLRDPRKPGESRVMYWGEDPGIKGQVPPARPWRRRLASRHPPSAGQRGVPCRPLVAVPRGLALPRRFGRPGSAPAGGPPRPAPLAARPHKGLWAAARASRGRIQRHGPGDFVPARDAGVPRDRHRAGSPTRRGRVDALSRGANRGFRDRWCSSGAHRGVRAADHGRGALRRPARSPPWACRRLRSRRWGGASPSAGQGFSSGGVDGGSRRLVVNPQAVFPAPAISGPLGGGRGPRGGGSGRGSAGAHLQEPTRRRMAVSRRGSGSRERRLRHRPSICRGPACLRQVDKRRRPLSWFS